MNRQAYIDGYLYKQADMADTAWDTASSIGSKVSPLFNFGKKLQQGKQYLDHVSREDKTPQTFTGEHESKFMNPLTKRLLQNSKWKFMSDPYKPQPMGVLERFATPGMIKDYSASVEKRIRDEIASGNISEETKNLYRTNPKVRAAFQQQGWNKVTGYAKKAAPWVLGGGALVLMMSTLFRKKQQGAPPAQIAALQRQIQQMQARQRMQQQPMRLNLVGNR